VRSSGPTLSGFGVAAEEGGREGEGAQEGAELLEHCPVEVEGRPDCFRI